MVLKAKSKVIKNRNSSTFYLIIPAKMVADSQFPFQPDEEVELQIKKDDQTLVVYGDKYQIKQSVAKAREKLKNDAAAKSTGK